MSSDSEEIELAAHIFSDVPEGDGEVLGDIIDCLNVEQEPFERWWKDHVSLHSEHQDQCDQDHVTHHCR